MGLYHSDLVGDQDEHGNFHLTRDLAEHLHFEYCCQLQRTVMEIRDEVKNFRAGREGPDFGEWLEEKLQKLTDDINVLDDDIDRVNITDITCIGAAGRLHWMHWCSRVLKRCVIYSLHWCSRTFCASSRLRS